MCSRHGWIETRLDMTTQNKKEQKKSIVTREKYLIRLIFITVNEISARGGGGESFEKKIHFPLI